MTFNVPKPLGWILQKLYRRKLTKLSIEYERAYYDDEQIYSSFARQYFAELDEMVATMKKEVEEEIGEKL